MNKYITYLAVTFIGIAAFMAISRYGLGHKGAGDTVHALALTVGIKQLENCGCAVRQRKWNEALPY